MNKLFEINKEADITDEDVLLGEISDTFACTALYNQQQQSISRLDYFTFPATQAIESIKEIFADHKKNDGKKAIISASFSEAFLIPSSLYKEENVQNIFMDVAASKIITDPIPEWQMVTAYAMPTTLYNQLSTGNTTFFHTYTPTLKVYNGFDGGQQVMVHFSPQQFRVMVKKEGQLQLAQIYSYTVPLDVVYYLLSIYQQFNLSKEETFLLLSGLVEKDSALYKELDNYFLNIHFNSSSVKGKLEDFPQHYFTSLYNLAACAL